MRATPTQEGPLPSVLMTDRGDASSDGITVGQIFKTLWRRRTRFALTTFAITALGFAVVKMLTPSFTAEAVIVLSARHDSVLDLEGAVLQANTQDAVVRSETDALLSRSFVDRIVDREHLMDDPEFDPYARAYQPNLLMRLGIVDRLPKFLQPYLSNKPLDPTPLTAAQREYIVASQVLKNYSVTPDSKTYTVKIDFTSVDSEKAARIANAFAEEYMNTQIDDQVSQAEAAAKWLKPQLDALGKDVRDRYRAVEDFKAANNIIDLPSATPDGNTLALQQVQSVAQELDAAQNARSQLEAAQQELERLPQDPAHALSAPAVAAAPAVETVRMQEAAAAAKLAEVSATYGPDHPLVLAAKSALANLQQQLQQEVTSAVAQLGVQLRQARSTEANLRALLAKRTDTRGAENRALPRLMELQTEQSSAQSTYNDFVNGMYRAITEDGVPTPRGQIVQHADPLAYPNNPNMLLYMAIIIVAAGMIGVAVVFIVEARDTSLHSSEELEEVLDVPVLGLTLHARKPGLLQIGRPSQSISRQVALRPDSALSESIRLARTAISFSRGVEPPRTLMVTSAMPGEGKTTFALSLAQSSAQSGARIMLVEADLRRTTFQRELAPQPRRGLTDYLRNEASLAEIIGIDEASGLHFIPARERVASGSDLLRSPRMADLLQELRAQYDLVVLDTPPAAVAADALQFGNAIDAAVMVVKWGSTPQHLVTDAVRKLRAANVPLVGAVMTQVDSKRYSSYGAGKLAHEYASSYYSG